MSFFEELKRRNVFRVGIAYAIAAWVLLQVVDLVLENISAPDWVMKVFLLVVVVGFPVAVIIAWAFEITPDGVKREQDVDRSQSVTRDTGRKLDRIIIGFLALAVVFLVIDPFEAEPEPSSTAATPQEIVATPTGQTSAGRDKSVAVLPFAFRSNNPDDKFFAEGMHDDLLTQLAKIGSLKVISRTSVMEYKNTTKKIPEIAAELGVATIVEGGLQRSGSRIRFNAQLIDAKTDEHLWAETYDRELTAENLFDIQTEIALAIAAALKATLSPEEEARIERVLTTNLEAWQAYQRAIQMSVAQATQAMKAGLADVDLALKLDPEFAAAWSLRAILLLQQYWFFDNQAATRNKALEAIKRGRRIDPTLAELDLAEGYYHYWGFADYEKALPFLQKASTALPNDARIHMARAYVLRRMGNWEDTLAAMHRASELDPRNEILHLDIMSTSTLIRRFEKARTEFDKAAELDSNSRLLWIELALLNLLESGDITSSRHLYHLVPADNAEVQMDVWRSSLYVDDLDGAMQDVNDWPDKFLDYKFFLMTRPLLTGLTHLYFGNTEQARPLLHEAKLEFESLLKDDSENYPINRSLCLITGGLGDLDGAQKYCSNALEAARPDAVQEGFYKFDSAAGLALAGDAEGAVELLEAMLVADAGPTIYPVIYHPAFDRIKDDPVYIEFLEQYGPGVNQ